MSQTSQEKSDNTDEPSPSKEKVTMFVLIASLLIALVSARIAAPNLIKSKVNQQLDITPGISGNVEEISLSLFRGAYQAHGLSLYLQETKTGVPSIYIKDRVQSKQADLRRWMYVLPAASIKRLDAIV